MTARRDVLERWWLGWRLLAGLTLLVVAGAVAAGMPAGWSGASRFWALFAAFTLWYWISPLIGRARLHASLLVSLLYFAPGWALWALLLALHPATFAFAGIFFPLTYSHLPPGRAITFAIVPMLLMFLAGNGWDVQLTPGTVIGAGLALLSSVMLALFIHQIIRQGEERKRLIQELETTRATLAQTERQAGILEERQRLAQQIHDTVAQGFVGIVTHLEAAETSLDRGTPAARHLTAAKGSAREGLAAARRLVWDLRPDLQSGEPLPAVLDRQLREWSAKNGVRAERVVTGAPRHLDADHEATLVQAAREVLNNVRAHARASRVTLTLSYMEDEVALDVQDDGVGARVAARSDGGGFGLRALEQRVSALGGRCTLEGAAGAGTTLSVTLPLASAKA